MKLALDTNRYSDVAKQIPECIAVVGAADAVFLPFVVLAELRAGFRSGSREAFNERQLGVFLSQPGVSVIFADDATIGHYVELNAALRARGKPIPAHDLWIAALCVQHGLRLYTRDRQFDHLPQVAKV